MKPIEQRMLSAIHQHEPFTEGSLSVKTDGHRYVISARDQSLAVGIPGRLTIRGVELNPLTVSRINALLTLDVEGRKRLERNPADNDWILVMGERRVRTWQDGITIKTGI